MNLTFLQWVGIGMSLRLKNDALVGPLRDLKSIAAGEHSRMALDSCAKKPKQPVTAEWTAESGCYCPSEQECQSGMVQEGILPKEAGVRFWVGVK